MSGLHLTIYNAKKLLLRQNGINDKKHSLVFLKKDYDFSKNDILDLSENGLIKLKDFFIANDYIAIYHKKRKEFELQEQRKSLASISGGEPYNYKDTKEWKNYLTDQYCGLGVAVFSKLYNNYKAEIDESDFLKIINQDVSDSGIGFTIRFSPEKLQDFLNKRIDLFIQDELDLSEKLTGTTLFRYDDSFPSNIDKSRKFLSYERQKEYFATAMVREINEGYPANNLKINYAQFCNKTFSINTNFIETALAMEKEGLIEIKDIIEQMPKNPVIMTSDFAFKYPTIIQMKVIQEKFNPYYALVYKKYNPPQPEPVKKEIIENAQVKQQPIPIMIVNEVGVKGLEKGLEAISKKGKQDDKPKFPHKLPAGTKWENITIKFEDENNVWINVKGFKEFVSYKNMGFIGKGNNPEPSVAWTFLKVLSMQKITGELAINDKDARETYKKQKELLTESLQEYFSIDYDPFYPYHSSTEKIGKSYKIKLTLIPPPTKQRAEEAYEKDEIKEYLTQEAPQVYEE